MKTKRLYQLGKSNGKYFWTGTVQIFPEERDKYQDDENYKWVDSITEVRKLTKDITT